MDQSEKIQQYRENWLDERNGAALYQAISELQKDERLKTVFKKMAEAEERHSCFWEAKLRKAKQALPAFKLNWRTKALIFLARRFGPEFVLPNILSLERSDSHKYDQQSEAKSGGLPQQEQSHAR